jgi:hypothetical protein
MNAELFVQRYQDFVSELEQVVKKEFYPIIRKMQTIDVHDLVTPDTYFSSEWDARGYVWNIFRQLKRA